MAAESPRTDGLSLAEAFPQQRGVPCEDASHLREGEGCESPVLRIGRALAVVPSEGPSRKGWSKLGFELTNPFAFMGCTAFDVVLASGGLRFLVAPRKLETTPLGDAIGERLERGSGLLGWSWACQSVFRSRSVLEAGEKVEFPKAGSGAKSVVVPHALTPGAVTLLEPLVHEQLPAHANGAERLARILVTVRNCDSAADIYERAFKLRARRETRAERRSAVLAVGAAGGPEIEVVAPLSPTESSAAGYPWGLVLRSKDLDATVRYLATIGVETGKPLDAPEGGRAVALPMQIGGISLVFAGD